MVGTLVFNGLNKVVVKRLFNFVPRIYIELVLNLWNSFMAKKIKMHVRVPCGINKLFQISEDCLTTVFAIWINEIDQFGKLLHGSKITAKTNLTKNRSSRPEVFCEKGVLRNFTKFTGKHRCESFFFNVFHVSVLRCFRVNFVKF